MAIEPKEKWLKWTEVGNEKLTKGRAEYLEKMRKSDVENK